ncbi:hypothetical protein MMC21_006912 [Puttea exsequens]|nr:hypothetical protein [Puttea exsequens]
MLTFVAFVFIRLNFATSFLGMNVPQLGTGATHIGFFFLTTSLVGGIGFLLSTSVKSLEQTVSDVKTRVYDKNFPVFLNREAVHKRDIVGKHMKPPGTGNDRTISLWRQAMDFVRKTMKPSRSGNDAEAEVQ